MSARLEEPVPFHRAGDCPGCVARQRQREHLSGEGTAERQNYRPSAAAWPAGPYLRRMSFLTFVTPPTPRVTSTALYILAWVLTKPLN